MTLPAEDGPPEELASGLETFLEALELATGWLEEAPERAGGGRVAIVETEDGVGEEVWAHPPSTRGDTPEQGDGYRFGPVASSPPLRERSPRSWTARLADVERDPLPELPTPAPAAQTGTARSAVPARDATAGPARPPLRLPRPSRRTRAEVARTARSVWDDPPSRYLLSVAVFGVWLAVALLDPGFLVVPLVAVGCLRWRWHRRPAAVDADEIY